MDTYTTHLAAQSVADELRELRVRSATRRVETESAPRAYTTLSLLEDAADLLGWQAERGMKTAQSLFEQGLITYPRTDSDEVDPGAAALAKDVIRARYGADALRVDSWLGSILPSHQPATPGAHEAIRPTDPRTHPDETALPADEATLYRMIWQRFVAFYMKEARYEVIEVELESTQ